MDIGFITVFSLINTAIRQGQLIIHAIGIRYPFCKKRCVRHNLRLGTKIKFPAVCTFRIPIPASEGAALTDRFLRLRDRTLHSRLRNKTIVGRPYQLRLHAASALTVKGNLSDIKGLLLTGGAVTVCLLIILNLLCAGAFYRIDRLYLFQP